jgi:hypothetical protein
MDAREARGWRHHLQYRRHADALERRPAAQQHRVRNPQPHEYQGARYSLAFFCQANEDGDRRAGQKISAHHRGGIFAQRISANFSNRY